MTRPDALEWLALREPRPVSELVDPTPDLRTLVLDGVAVEILPGRLRAADLGVTPQDRAGAVRADVPRGAVVARRSALWVHTGSFRPATVEVAGAGRRSSTPRAQVHADVVGPAEVVDVGGVAVTSRERTAVDLARWAPADAIEAWLDCLAPAGLRVDELAALLEAAAGRPGVIRARAVLEAAGLAPRRT